MWHGFYMIVFLSVQITDESSQTVWLIRYESYLLQAGKIRYLEPFLESFFYFWTYLYHSWSTAVSFVSFNRQLCHFYIFRCLSSKRWFSLSCIFRLHPSNNCWLPPIETSWSQLYSKWWRSWAFGNYKKLKLITKIHQNESNTIQNDILTFSVKISCCIVL